MARFLFVTWGGAGNQTPIIGLAATLAGRGHAVTLAGYDEQRGRFESLGFAFRTLSQAQQHWPASPPEDWMPVLVDTVWACRAHLRDVPDLLAAEHYDLMVIDCLMFTALAAAERESVPTAVLVHSARGHSCPRAVAWISRTLAALSKDRYRVLVTTGMADVIQMPGQGDAVLVPFVPHADVLPYASVTVTHAGHGTVAASLAHGVPLVALPNLAADQPALAGQIERLGAGIALDGDNATPYVPAEP